MFDKHIARGNLKLALHNRLLMADFLSLNLPFSYCLNYQHDILLAAGDRQDTDIHQCLINLIKFYPELFYQTLQIQTEQGIKNTYIISHVLEEGNLPLLQAFISQGLSLEIKQFLNSSSYNIFYRNNINGRFDSQTTREVINGDYWDSIIALLVEHDILPVERIEEFCSVLFNKPVLLKKALSHHYFEHSYQHYWDKGLKAKNKSWVWFEMMNTSVAKVYDGFKKEFSHDFKNQALNQYAWCNTQSCLYWPDVIIYHDNVDLLHDMIMDDKPAAKKWFKNRVYKIRKNFTQYNLKLFFHHNTLKENHMVIQKNFPNPWSYLTQKDLPLNEDYQVDNDSITLNSIDYALFCQSEQCLQTLIDLLGFDTLIDNRSLDQSPEFLKRYWQQLKLSHQLPEHYAFNNKIDKVTKI